MRMGNVKGVIVPNFWVELLGDYFDPIRELHATSSTLCQNTISVGAAEYYIVQGLGVVGEEDLVHHFSL